MEALKPIEEDILNFLREKASESNVVPSIREIGAAVGLKSTSSVQNNLDNLEKKGYIERDPMLKRSIRLVGQPENVHSVPLVGNVAAGQPILATESIEAYLPYSGYVSPDKPLFALKVRGESMIEVGIFDGDIIFAEKTNVARNGEIVVALVGDEATVKTFYKENGHYRLQPENSTYTPIIVSEVSILGKVVAVFRYL